MGSIKRKRTRRQSVTGLTILAVLILSSGCQPKLIDGNSSIALTASPSIEPTFIVTLPVQEQMTPFKTITPEVDMQDLIDKAITDLAQRLAIPISDIVILDATNVVWPDGSLGCPEEGMQYAQVLTPGYLIRLKYGEQEFEYHASKGTTVIYCEDPTPPVPGAPGDV